MRCPVCESNSTTHYVRGFVVAVCLGLLIGFVSGQLFHSWEYGKMFSDRNSKLGDRIEELQKGYVPPKR